MIDSTVITLPNWSLKSLFSDVTYVGFDGIINFTVSLAYKEKGILRPLIKLLQSNHCFLSFWSIKQVLVVLIFANFNGL